MKIQRIFLPVGQGAFYLEKHPNMNVVYDCGNLKKTKSGQNLVAQSLTKKDDIDILFISHFDYDHVSLISILKKTVNKIKSVVIPLLDEKTKHLIININRAVENGTVTLIKNPKSFFDSDTKIIYTSIEFTEQDATIEIDSINDEEIISGNTTLTTPVITYDWGFIPFNYKRLNRLNDLENELIKNGFDVSKLKENADYTVDASINERKKLKDIYNKLDGKINENSMLTYSGPINSTEFMQECFIASFFPRLLRSRFYSHSTCDVGCVYTGDSDLNKVDIKTVFKRVINSIGTIQIPHHGDINSYNSSTFKSGEFICPISYGIKNTYGHPSPIIISDLIANDCIPIHITEDNDSYFIQHIHIVVSC